MESNRDFSMRLIPSPAIKESLVLWPSFKVVVSPLSVDVLQSTDCATTFHLTSVSASRPFKIGGAQL